MASKGLRRGVHSQPEIAGSSHRQATLWQVKCEELEPACRPCWVHATSCVPLPPTPAVICPSALMEGLPLERMVLVTAPTGHPSGMHWASLGQTCHECIQ